MKLAPLLLLPLLLPACSGERKDAAWWANEKEIIELRSEIELARYRMEMLAPPAVSTEPSTPPAELSEEIESLSVAKTQLTLDIAGLKDGWAKFRESVLAERRTAAMGMTFDTFQTAGGRVYRDVTVSRIDDGGVSLRHEAGTARLRLDDLDENRQVFFGLDGELAAIAHEAEAEDRIAYDRWVSKGVAAAEAEEAKLAETRKKEEKHDATARALATSRLTSTPSTLTASFGGLGDTRTVSSGRRYSYYGSYSRPRTRFYYTYNTTPTWNGCTTTYRPNSYQQNYVTPVSPVSPASQCPTTNPFNP